MLSIALSIATDAWVWDHPFFLILNVAIGGNWPGSPDARRSFRNRWSSTRYA